MKQLIKQLADAVDDYTEFVLAMSDQAMANSDRAQMGGEGIVATVITVVVVGIVGVVGLLIYSEVESAVSLDVAGARSDPDNASRLENASATLGDGFGDAMDLLPVVLIVLVAALVILAIGIMRTRR